MISYLSYLVLAYIGATKGLHRYWSHKEFKAGVWFEWLSLWCALFIGVYKPLGWIGIHRMHHAYSDTDKDPHPPGWKSILSDWDTSIPMWFVKDHIRNPRIRFFQKYGKFLIWPVIILSPYTILLGYIGMGVLNTFGHKDGGPRNVWWINLFAPGEGQHRDHHEEGKRPV